MIIVGLTGGIGSGKSVVAELFRIMDIPVYDSDVRSKILSDTDQDLKQSLVALFGEEIYSNELLDRRALANRIFGDEEALKAVNALIHPAVVRDFKNWVAENSRYPVVAQESAILFEAGLDTFIHYDHIICVWAPEEIRIERSCKGKGMSPESVRARMNNQISEEERMKKSDFIIYNDDVQAILPQVLNIVQRLTT